MAGSAPPEATNRVTFDLIDAPPGTGVRMSYLDYMDPQDETRKFMVNAEEPIDCFTRDDGSKCSSVHFRIKWPGYSHVTRSQTRAIRVFNPGPVVNPFITRIELAIAIVGHFKTWAEHAQTMGIGPTFQEWAVAPEALYLDNLWLVSFYQMPDRICYAEINTYFK